MPDSPKQNSHIQRWVTGVAIGLPVFATIIAGPAWSWLLVVIIATLIGLWELHGLFFPEPLCSKWRLFSFAVGLSLPLATYSWGLNGLNFSLVASLFAAFSLMVFSSPLGSKDISTIALLTLAWLYVPYLLSFTLLLAALSHGRFWITFVLAVIIAGDAGAYHTGLRMGRHKLYEIISPKKTVEGALGGLALSVAIGTLLGLIFSPHAPLAKLPLFCLLIAITGQIGDLIESMIKRNFGKKDSSGLLPGHGGILDRLDSLLFAFPVMWSLLKWCSLY